MSLPGISSKIHGFACITRDVINKKKHKCNCIIGKLARSIYFRCYRRDIKLAMSIINEFANSFTDIYEKDTSPRRKDFFQFLDEQIKSKIEKQDKKQHEQKFKIHQI